MRTESQLRLMKALCTLQDEREKKAFMGLVTGGARLLGGAGKSILTRAALPAAARGGQVAGKLGRYAAKNPLKSLFGGLTAHEGLSRAGKAMKKQLPGGRMKLRSIY